MAEPAAPPREEQREPRKRIGDMTVEERYDLLRRAVNDFTGDCDEACDSYGHTETCKRCDAAAWMEAQQLRVTELESSLAAATQRAERAEAALEEAQRTFHRLSANYDHEDDAHKYRNGSCRVCIAEEAGLAIGDALALRAPSPGDGA